MSEHDLAPELSAMLRTRAGDMPAAVEPAPGTLHRARARRRTKLAALGGGAAAAVAVVVAVVATMNPTDATDVEIVPATDATETTAPHPTPGAGIAAGAIVAATADGRIVVLNDDGTVGREVLDTGGRYVDTIAVRGDALWYLAKDSEGDPCGTLTVAATRPGVTLDPVVLANVADFAVSGDGAVLAYTGRDDEAPEQCADGGGGTGRIVVRGVAGGGELVIPHDGTSSSGDPLPLHAERLALNHDGSMVAAELCWEGCNVALLENPVDCIVGDLVCDYQPPKWDTATFVDDGDNGFATAPVFQGELVAAVVCDCPFEGTPTMTVRTFDPSTGAETSIVQDVPADTGDLAIVGATLAIRMTTGTVVLYGPDGEPRTAEETFATVTIAYAPAE